MLTVTLLLVLQVEPAPGLLAEGGARRVQLVADAAPLRSRAELLAERERLNASRPPRMLPSLAAAFGGIGAGAALSGFFLLASSFQGVAVYVAVLLLSAAVVSLGVAVLAILYLVRTAPAQRAVDAQVAELDALYREGRCRTEPGQPPCRAAPRREPQSGRAPLPTLELARF